MIRAREAGMLTRERMDRMLSAPSYQEAAKLLCDCGYEDMSACSASGVDEALSRLTSRHSASASAIMRDVILSIPFMALDLLAQTQPMLRIMSMEASRESMA